MERQRLCGSTFDFCILRRFRAFDFFDAFDFFNVWCFDDLIAFACVQKKENMCLIVCFGLFLLSFVSLLREALFFLVNYS